MIENDLLNIINTYSGDGYYKYGNIPANKLKNAMQSYPVDPSDTPLALIDSTVFGSAKTGMVIGFKGVYFKNDWTTRVDKNFIDWEELSRSNSVISNGAMGCVMLISGCEINLSGSGVKRSLLINLLNQILNLYRRMDEYTYQNEVIVNDSSHQASDLVMIENDAPKKNHTYQFILPELIALCIAADGNVNDSEVELATCIIENDDLIIDKHEAFESLMMYIDKYVSDRNKSSAVFKMKIAGFAAKLSEITDSLQKENLFIVLDGFVEIASTDEINYLISKAKLSLK